MENTGSLVSPLVPSHRSSGQPSPCPDHQATFLLRDDALVTARWDAYNFWCCWCRKRFTLPIMFLTMAAGREFFISLMLFRISKPRDWEQTRAHGLSSRKRFMSSDSLASIGVDELDTDHDLASKKKGTQARVKKVWINHAISIPKRSKSGRELWKAARIKLRGSF